MAYIKKQTLEFDAPAVMTDVANFKLYYGKESDGLLTYNSVFVNIPVVPSQVTYQVVIPDMIPITEGSWNLGVASEDAAGNISDMDLLTGFFDFTAPPAPNWK